MISWLTKAMKSTIGTNHGKLFIKRSQRISVLFLQLIFMGSLALHGEFWPVLIQRQGTPPFRTSRTISTLSFAETLFLHGYLGTLWKKPIEHPFQSKIESMPTVGEDVSEACTLSKNNLRNLMKQIHSSEYIRPNLSFISARVPEKVRKIVQGKSNLYR